MRSAARDMSVNRAGTEATSRDSAARRAASGRRSRGRAMGAVAVIGA
jgi:hypothetical protein